MLLRHMVLRARIYTGQQSPILQLKSHKLEAHINKRTHERPWSKKLQIEEIEVANGIKFADDARRVCWYLGAADALTDRDSQKKASKLG